MVLFRLLLLQEVWVGVIPLMPDVETRLVCLDLVSTTLGTDNLDNTFPQTVAALARAGGCLVGIVHWPFLRFRPLC